MPIAPKGFSTKWGDAPGVGQLLKEFQERVLSNPQLRHSPIGAVLRAITPTPESDVNLFSPQMGGAGKVVSEKSGEYLAPLVARALRSLPRGVRERLTKSAGTYRVAPEEIRTGIYHPLTGRIGVGQTGMRDPEIGVSTLAHELQHAADIGIVTPFEHREAIKKIGRTEPFFVPYKEAGSAAQIFRVKGYQPDYIPLELRAVSADKQVGPVYRRGEGGQRLFDAIGGSGEKYPHLSEEATTRFVKLRREESKALLAARKERGVQRRIRREEGLE